MRESIRWTQAEPSLCETDGFRVRCNGADDHTQAPFIRRYKQALFLHPGSVGLDEEMVPDSDARKSFHCGPKACLLLSSACVKEVTERKI